MHEWLRGWYSDRTGVWHFATSITMITYLPVTIAPSSVLRHTINKTQNGNLILTSRCQRRVCDTQETTKQIRNHPLSGWGCYSSRSFWQKSKGQPGTCHLRASSGAMSKPFTHEGPSPMAKAKRTAVTWPKASEGAQGLKPNKFIPTTKTITFHPAAGMVRHNPSHSPSYSGLKKTDASPEVA